VGALGAVQFADDGAGDDIARSEFLGFAVTLHEALEIGVAQDAAFAAEGFGEEKAGSAFDGQGGGMELHELHIGERGASFVGDGDAVAGGDFGIGGLTIDLAYAAGCEQDSAGVDCEVGAIGFVDEMEPGDAAGLEDQIGGEGMGAEMEMRDGMGSGEECTADFTAGGISMRVEDAGTAVGGFAGEGQLGAGTVEFGAPFDELGDVAGALFDEEGDALGAA